MSAGRRSGARGAVLLEALVAAAVVAVALMFVMALLAHEARLTAAAPAQRRAFHALEAVLEGVRAGAVALPSPTTTFLVAEPPWVPLPPRATLWLDARPTDVADLWEVEATVRYRAGRDLQRRSLVTRVWRPHGPP
jgi:Tfp pilus assembly protein PilV